MRNFGEKQLLLSTEMYPSCVTIFLPEQNVTHHLLPYPVSVFQGYFQVSIDLGLTFPLDLRAVEGKLTLASARSLVELNTVRITQSCAQGVLPKKLGGGAWPVFKKPYPIYIYDQTLLFSLSYL